MVEKVTIGGRFNGPPHSGNGGYSCGVAAGFVSGPATARLKAPPPLDTPLLVERDGPLVRLTHDGATIAEAEPAPAPDVSPPGEISLAAARAAAGYENPAEHYFPTCFVCGPQRGEGDGLGIFAGAVAGAPVVAAPWTPHASLAADDGLVAREHVWAALDCPSYFAFRRPGLMALLGSLTAAIDRRPRPGEACFVTAWPDRSEGRKHLSFAALMDADGAVMARAQALWIELKPEAMAAMQTAG